MRERTVFLGTLAVLALAATGLVFAHGGGGMGGGSMMGGSGMMVVADDGSLLVTNMDMGGMMDGHKDGGSTVDRELIDISSNGTERWRVSFTEGWPIPPAVSPVSFQRKGETSWKVPTPSSANSPSSTTTAPSRPSFLC